MRLNARRKCYCRWHRYRRCWARRLHPPKNHWRTCWLHTTEDTEFEHYNRRVGGYAARTTGACDCGCATGVSAAFHGFQICIGQFCAGRRLEVRELHARESGATGDADYNPASAIGADSAPAFAAALSFSLAMSSKGTIGGADGEPLMPGRARMVAGGGMTRYDAADMVGAQ